ncbi:MAG: Methyltransferase type 11 [Candidatus Solibacter sp.]|nr:Methyltransferase type 11 [Candidatus Solibacter sp.]
MTTPIPVQTEQYAECVGASKRVRWDIDRDVIRGREFDTSHKFLPDSISGVDQLGFLSEDEALFLSQIQGRTYANIFGLVERFINCKVLELSKFHWTGDQIALEALVRFSDEELKHQELFRRIERMIASKMPPGYNFLPEPNAVAAAVLSKSTWAVLGVTLMIELFTQTHYLKSIQPDSQLSPLFKDVFLYHWKEESQHARIDELEWVRENARLSAEQRDQAVDDMIALVGAVDGIVCAQAAADVRYFLTVKVPNLSEQNRQRLHDRVLRAYRWQYILSGVEERRFQKVLSAVITGEQMRRIEVALAPLIPSADPADNLADVNQTNVINPNKALWEKGDFTAIAAFMRESGETLVESLRVKPPIRALDLGCGDGTTAVPLARLGAEVTGIDIARNLVAAGNKRAAEQGLRRLKFQEGDACNLEGIDDHTFDLTVSVFGAMFASKPYDVAREMVRVTKPGGRIVMGNWIPNDPSFVSQLLKISSLFTPPPPEGFISPMLWGVESHVIERFGQAGVPPEKISMAKDTYYFVSASKGPADFIGLFRRFYGPTMNAFEAAKQSGRAEEFHSELLGLAKAHNKSTNDGTLIPATFLRVTVSL